MIQLFFDGKSFYKDNQIESLQELTKNILNKRKELDKVSQEDILNLFHKFSQNILTDPRTRGLEGVAFLSQWARRTNLRKLIERNFEDPKILTEYVEKKGILLISQPKGLVGHWMAGNVVLLGMFSLIQSILVRNANILRIPIKSIPTMTKLLKVFQETKYKDLDGSTLISPTAIIYYPKEDHIYNEELSKLSDARIIWGGKEAIDAISNTAKKETCEDIIFGPKYSFSIIDKDAINDTEYLRKNMNNLVYDIFFSEQNSCTSPHVLFCEVKYSKLKKIATEIKNSFENLPERYEKKEITMFQASNILKVKSSYALNPNKDVIASKDNSWTILLDDKLRLEEPVKSRTIFIKSCDNIKEVSRLITPKIQTIGYAFKDKQKLTTLAKDLNLKGVSRIVPLGQMNYHDAPWDGKLLLTRLVNFNSLKLAPNIK